MVHCSQNVVKLWLTVVKMKDESKDEIFEVNLQYYFVEFSTSFAANQLQIPPFDD